MPAGKISAGRRWRRFGIPAIALAVVLIAAFVVRPLLGDGGQASLLEDIETAEVTRTSLERTVSAFGSIVMPHQVNLTFGGSGTVKELKVKMGDSVTKGDVLAQLDTTPLELAVLRAEDELKKAERALTDTMEPYDEVDIAVAESTLAAAESRLSGAYDAWALDQQSTAKWASVKSAEADLERAQETWDKIIDGPEPEDVAEAERLVEIKQANLDDAGRKLVEATIIAPYNGIVAEVFLDEGARANEDTTAVVHLVDPTAFELEALVDEIDIPLVQLGQQVNISIDALPQATFNGKVTAVGPVGTSQSGVVSFPITVSVEAPTGTSEERGRERSSERGSRRRPEGTTSQESGSGEGTRSRTPRTPQPEQQQSSFAALKEGLTATGTIIIEQRSNVLTVPSRAVRILRGQATVQVVTGNTTEERPVQVGFTDGQLTEIVSGLEEGQQVVIPQTAIRSTTPGPQGGGRGGPALH
jgi:multidrug efflux pump subunit AcrA (membrane-fusion protein)